MALVGTFEAPDDFSAVGLHVTARPLQRLNARFLAHANYERVGRWRKIAPDNIGAFGHELRIGANAPGTLPLQANPLLPQSPPYRVWRNAPSPDYRPTVPDRPPGRWRFFQHPQNLLAQIERQPPRRAGSRPIFQPRRPSRGKAIR